MKPFQGVDYYRCDDLLTIEERSVRDTVRRWVDNQYMPEVEEYFDKGYFDLDLIPQLAELGLLGIKIKGYGLSRDEQYGLWFGVSGVGAG